MSKLKHLSIDELAHTVTRCARARELQVTMMDRNTKQIEALLADNRERGAAIHNIGQREVWARKYLAEKQIAQASRSTS